MISATFMVHKDFDTAEEVAAFEQETIDKIKAFAESLPGFGGGTVNAQTQPQTVLQASDGGATANGPTGPTTANTSNAEVTVTSDSSGAETVAAGAAPGNPPAADSETPQPASSQPSADTSSDDPLAGFTEEALAAEISRRKTDA